MPGSVGPIKLPIQSTFDDKGIVAAEAGLKRLSQTAVGPGGGGGGGGGGAAPARPARSAWQDDGDAIFEKTRTANEKYEYQVRHLEDLHKRGAISTDTYRRAQKQALDILPKGPGLGERLGLGQAGRAIAGETGLGGFSSAMGAAGPVAAMAAGGLAVAALAKKTSDLAIANRDNARAMGVSTEYYQTLSVAAHRAGTSMTTVTSAIGQARGMASAALSGDLGTQVYLSSLGLSMTDLQAAGGDTEALTSRMYSAARTPGQQAALFGSVTGAAAVGTAGQRPFYMPTAGDNAALADMGGTLSGIGGAAKGATSSIFSSIWRRGGALGQQFAGNKDSVAEIMGKEDAQAAMAERREQQGKYHAEMAKAGGGMLPSIIGAREREELTERSQRGFVYSEDKPENARYKQLAAIQRESATAAALAPVRSNSENVEAQVGLYSKTFTAARDRNEAVDSAREIGDTLTNYAESITRSGSLAGAYDANSVAGYSQMVGSEYQMDQSKDTLRMVELLIKIAENTGKIDSVQGQYITENLGFRSADPIMGM